ncbi:MAG: hypothetical protein LBG95_01340 [Treponema sp.]|nr:hypothetical protein [Treponema sp.]
MGSGIIIARDAPITAQTARRVAPGRTLRYDTQRAFYCLYHLKSLVEK